MCVFTDKPRVVYMNWVLTILIRKKTGYDQAIMAISKQLE